MGQAGYLLKSVLCTPCGSHTDTIHHRFFECEATADLRHAMLTDKVFDNSTNKWVTMLEWAALYQQHDTAHPEGLPRWLVLKGLARHPAVGPSKPAADGNTTTGSTTELFVTDLVCTDGHCNKMFHPSLNRASWAVIGYDAASCTTKHTIQGPVWSSLPQTSAATEFVAIASVLSV